MSVHYLQNPLAALHGRPAQDAVNLSPRQIEVLLLLGEGLANKVIGRRLGISDCTVKQHVQAILEEFGATSRLQAVIFAYRHGILPCNSESAAYAGVAGIARPPLAVTAIA